jgi:hypothetical protein
MSDVDLPLIAEPSPYKNYQLQRFHKVLTDSWKTQFYVLRVNFHLLERNLKICNGERFHEKFRFDNLSALRRDVFIYRLAHGSSDFQHWPA